MSISTISGSEVCTVKYTQHKRKIDTNCKNIVDCCILFVINITAKAVAGDVFHDEHHLWSKKKEKINKKENNLIKWASGTRQAVTHDCLFIKEYMSSNAIYFSSGRERTLACLKIYIKKPAQFKQSERLDMILNVINIKVTLPF